MLDDLSISEAKCADVTFITDAAATMVAAFRVPNRTVMKCITCACHVLNTCLQNAANQKPNSQFKLDDEGPPIFTLNSVMQCVGDILQATSVAVFRLHLSKQSKHSGTQTSTCWSHSSVCTPNSRTFCKKEPKELDFQVLSTSSALWPSYFDLSSRPR
ncbi:hypothetical protein RvY_02904 [Ramazzottius varieornatus]|uniref:DUF659 domain-containing protein n=1 Tax=Ramazzottius varieornatus TaxID=947166 RepID=A0A1D1UWF8_RAMVA|nr:hypothetical protein RvY_02904 [Ramazzottius varieornatus]